MTRQSLCTMVTLLVGLSFPAVAGTDSNEAPNPFTQAPNPAANLSTSDKASGGGAPNPAILASPVDPSVPGVNPANVASPSDDGFYQATKRDTGGR